MTFYNLTLYKNLDTANLASTISSCMSSWTLKLVEEDFAESTLSDLHELYRVRCKLLFDVMMYPARIKKDFREEMTKVLDEAWEFHPDGPVVAMTGRRFDSMK
jgi:hypothetical protein